VHDHLSEYAIDALSDQGITRGYARQLGMKGTSMHDDACTTIGTSFSSAAGRPPNTIGAGRLPPMTHSR